MFYWNKSSTAKTKNFERRLGEVTKKSYSSHDFHKKEPKLLRCPPALYRLPLNEWIKLAKDRKCPCSTASKAKISRPSRYWVQVWRRGGLVGIWIGLWMGGSEDQRIGGQGGWLESSPLHTSCSFLRQETLLHFVSLDRIVSGCVLQRVTPDAFSHVPFVITNNPALHSISSIIHKHFNILSSSQHCANIWYLRLLLPPDVPITSATY